MSMIKPITDGQFNKFKNLIYDVAGISMAPQKKMLVAGRLAKRLRHYNLASYGEYYELVNSQNYSGEFQMMVDLLTTNETYFFREPQHFEFLANVVKKRQQPNKAFRVYSAASSSGEEVYTIAMVLAETMGMQPWEIIGSDISSRMLENCRHGVYPMSRASKMPETLMKKYCLKGIDDQTGMLMVDSQLRSRCQFKQINLMEALPNIGYFEVIFVRNVMIYFDAPTKANVVEKLIRVLQPKGYLITSHSESLHGITNKLKMVKPSIYQKLEHS